MEFWAGLDGGICTVLAIGASGTVGGREGAVGVTGLTGISGERTGFGEGIDLVTLGLDGVTFLKGGVKGRFELACVGLTDGTVVLPETVF